MFSKNHKKHTKIDSPAIPTPHFLHIHIGTSLFFDFFCHLLLPIVSSIQEKPGPFSWVVFTIAASLTFVEAGCVQSELCFRVWSSSYLD